MHLGKYQRRVAKRLHQWQIEQAGSRIWKKDHTVWSKQPQLELTDRLGWLDLPETMAHQVDGAQRIRRQSQEPMA